MRTTKIVIALLTLVALTSGVGIVAADPPSDTPPDHSQSENSTCGLTKAGLESGNEQVGENLVRHSDRLIAKCIRVIG